MFTQQTKGTQEKDSTKDSQHKTVDTNAKVSPSSSYAFIKSKAQFQIKQQRAELPDPSSSRTVSIFRKNPKPYASKEYTIKDHYKINVCNIVEEYKLRVNRVNVLASELLRLVDRHSPKLRLFSDTEVEDPISTGIPEAKEFHTYFENNIYSKVDFTPPNIYRYTFHPVFEGMGRGIFGKYFYLDNDFHLGNAFLDNNLYFCVIDNDWSFVPVTFHMHMYDEYKETHEENSIVVTRLVKRKYNQIISVRDYDSLPIIKDYQGAIWPWHDVALYPYSEIVANNIVFLNEKHFSAIKILVTPNIQKLFVDTHVEHKKDKGQLLAILENRYADLTKILPESKSFMTYLKNYRESVMQGIIYELNDFFLENRHYLPVRDKKNETREQWRQRVNPIIFSYIQNTILSYSALLERLGEVRLTKAEITKLEDFARATCADHESANSVAWKFYEEQRMMNFSTWVSQKLQGNNKVVLVEPPSVSMSLSKK